MTVQERIAWFNKTHKSEVRTNPVGIDWYILDNRKIYELGIAPKCCVENWTDMFSFEENTTRFKERYYINQLLSVFFQNEDRFDLEDLPRAKKKQNISKLLEIRKTFNTGNFGNWIIYTPIGNVIHTSLKELLENIVDKTKYEIAIMDGGDEERNGVNNANCEEIMLSKSIAANKNGKQMIFITSMMGIRSWSNKYVKNVLFLCNGGSGDVISQKIARGFTPCGEKINCHIYDFRLEYNYPVASYYLGEIIKSKNTEINTNTTDINIFLNKVIGSDKIEFWNVYGDDLNPLKKLNDNEIRSMMFTPSFLRYQVNNYLYENIDITLFNDEFPSGIKMFNNEHGMESENLKGDNSRDEKILKRKLNIKNKKEEKEYNNLQKYIEYIFINGKELNFKLYESDIIKKIYNDLINDEDEYKIFVEDVIELNYNAIKEILINLYKSGINVDTIFYPY